MDHVTPRSRLAGWDGVCGGGPLLPGLTPSPVGVSHCIPGAALCTHRSVSDVGAAGGPWRRTVRTAGQGYDGSELATGPCLCRAPWKNWGEAGQWEHHSTTPSVGHVPRAASEGPGAQGECGYGVCRTRLGGARRASCPEAIQETGDLGLHKALPLKWP